MDWIFVLEPANLAVRKGESATLSCRPPRSRPQAQVSWFKNNRLLQKGPYNTFDPIGDLVFHRCVVWICLFSAVHSYLSIFVLLILLNCNVYVYL